MAKGCIRSHGIRAKRDGTGNRTRGPGNTACLAGHASGRDATGSRSRDPGPGNASTRDTSARNAGSREPAVKAGSIADEGLSLIHI